MRVLILPALLSFLLLAAHFFRVNQLVPFIICCMAPWLLLIRQPWAIRLVQVLLVLGALEWLRTTLLLVSIRQQAGLPWERMTIILGSVTAVTALSALLLSFYERHARGFSRSTDQHLVRPETGEQCRYSPM